MNQRLESSNERTQVRQHPSGQEYESGHCEPVQEYNFLKTHRPGNGFQNPNQNDKSGLTRRIQRHSRLCCQQPTPQVH